MRAFTLFGGLTGCAAGFGMTIWMSRDWPLLVGGKPIAAIPPYVVIGFELTILYGALMHGRSASWCSRSLKSLKGRPYEPRFSDDRIGIFVPCRRRSGAPASADLFARGRLGGGVRPCGVAWLDRGPAAVGAGRLQLVYNNVPSPDDLLHRSPGSTT